MFSMRWDFFTWATKKIFFRLGEPFSLGKKDALNRQFTDNLRHKNEVTILMQTVTFIAKEAQSKR